MQRAAVSAVTGKLYISINESSHSCEKCQRTDADGNEIARPSFIRFIKRKGEVYSDEKKDDRMMVSIRQAHGEETAGMSDLDIEKVNARRMLRVAGWSTIFCKRASFFSLIVSS